MTKLFTGGLLLLAALLLDSCQQERVFEQKIDIPEHQWAISDTLSYEFTIPDTTQRYDFFFTIRHTLDFDFYNLYLRHTLQGPGGNRMSSLLHEAILFDQKTGKPKGQGSGGIYDYRVRALRGLRFSRTGPHRLKVQQYMRRDPLEGIMAVGIQVEPAQ